MSLVIIHGGQTGVDRGAHIGAYDNGWQIRGYMPKNGCDELGIIPMDVAKHLNRCLDSGLSARTRVNVDISQAVLVLVEDEDNPTVTPGTALTISTARSLKRPCLVIDPVRMGSAERVADWIQKLTNDARGQLRLYRELRLMVAGPRGSRWSDGQIEAAMLLRRLKPILEPPKEEQPLL